MGYFVSHVLGIVVVILLPLLFLLLFITRVKQKEF